MEAIENLRDAIITAVGEDAIVNETNDSEDYANYRAYQKLISLDYSTQEALEHISISTEKLIELEKKFDLE